MDCTLPAPLSMGFLRQEYWSGLPFSSPGHLPDPGVKPTFPAWQADSLPLCHLGRIKGVHTHVSISFLLLANLLHLTESPNNLDTKAPKLWEQRIRHKIIQNLK